MGLFGVNITLFYGEGEKAFLRLQEEIIKYNDDHSIPAWSMGKKKFSGLLASAPDCFAGSQGMVSDLFLKGRKPFSMTNRGLSIKLKVTPWATDTYLAYLDCAEETGLDKGRVRVGIFLRRLKEDDQYLRMNYTRRGLWFDTKRIQLRQDRPIQDRQLSVRQMLDLDCEKDCLKDRVYGFKISDDCLPSSARISAAHISFDNRVATLRPGSWGCAMVIDVSTEHQGLRKIALGFDFEFQPVCLLEDSFSDKQHLDADSEYLYDRSSVLADDIEWDKIIEGSRVYRRQIHNGLWALKGHRLHGLDVLLSESFTDRGSLVTLRRDKSMSRLIWEFDIDSLVGPFENHTTKHSLVTSAVVETFRRHMGSMTQLRA